MRFLYKAFKEELNQEETVRIIDGLIDIRGEKFTAFEVLKLATKEGQADSVCNRVFSEWTVEFIERKIAEADEFLEGYGALERFRRLSEICREGKVIPFVGAGMSCTSGYPMWTNFLKNQRQHTNISKEYLEALLKKGHYEEAAEEIAREIGEAGFTEVVESSYGTEKPILGPILILPHIFKSHVVTTNFDNVLERVYRDEGSALPDALKGSDAAELRRGLVGGKILLKLHGKAESQRGRILTKTEYENHYSENNTLKKR